ncbi:MAG TPA: hypothetical protein VNH18_15780 [Bryobacteraceae bacterium]|nr:hypothetical protein [Bryobacteraceae bacterium]
MTVAVYKEGRMPAPHSNDPQTGWMATVGLVAAGVGGVIGAVINQIGTWRAELIRRRTSTEQREQDRDEAYTDRVSGDLERLTARFDALVRQRETEALERVTKESQLADANAEQKRRIGHLENVIEQLEFQIQKLQDKKLEYDRMLEQKDAVIAEQTAIIEELQEQVANFGTIGKPEQVISPPVKRAAIGAQSEESTRP